MARKKANHSMTSEVDMTPMIDMTFQLIAFFMFMLNMKESEQNEHVQLPDSVLAKPPDAPIENPITMHVSATGDIYIGGAKTSLAGVGPYLNSEANSFQAMDVPLNEVNVIIRGHKDAETGMVQNLMKACLDQGYENFLLRAREELK
jgi:biopolymer transport protein ExbD